MQDGVFGLEEWSARVNPTPQVREPTGPGDVQALRMLVRHRQVDAIEQPVQLLDCQCWLTTRNSPPRSAATLPPDWATAARIAVHLLHGFHQ